MHFLFCKNNFSAAHWQILVELLVYKKNVYLPKQKSMKEKIDLWKTLNEKSVLKKYFERAKHRFPRWCQGARYYDVIKNFTNGMHYGFLDSRASAIAFQFFIAIFPFVLAMATLLPYFPFDKDVIIETISEFFSVDTAGYFIETINEFLSKPRVGLTSFSIVLLLFFASKGLSTMMKSLNNSYQPVLDRPWWVVRIISMIFAVGIFLCLVIIVALFSYQTMYVKEMVNLETIGGHVLLWLFRLTRLFLIVVFSIGVISFIFYYSPGGKKRVFKLWSPGSFVTVSIIALATYFFKIYLSNFNNYNYLYGSLGAMIIFMVLLKIYAIAMIIGFELNAAIWLARQNILDANKK